MAEKRIVCFQSIKVKRCRFFIFPNHYYIYLKRHFEKIVTNDFLVYSGGQLLLMTALRKKRLYTVKNKFSTGKLLQV